MCVGVDSYVCVGYVCVHVLCICTSDISVSNADCLITCTGIEINVYVDGASYVWVGGGVVRPREYHNACDLVYQELH